MPPDHNSKANIAIRPADVSGEAQSDAMQRRCCLLPRRVSLSKYALHKCCGPAGSATDPVKRREMPPVRAEAWLWVRGQVFKLERCHVMAGCARGSHEFNERFQ